MRRFNLVLLLGVGCALAAAGQEASRAGTTALSAAAADLNFVHKAFGDDFTPEPGIPPVTGDLDGDGVDDIVIAARVKNALLGEGSYNYKVVDPYYSFFGYGDVKVTGQFSVEDPHHKGLVLLVVHGNGPQAWRAENPKAKFVIVNLPFEKVSMRRWQIKKKLINAIFTQETFTAAGDAVIFWDGKKYRYEPLGSSLQ
jgi:hypothetical protein